MRSDSVDVKQIMDQIRARLREKRGVDYTEEQIRELATVKLERFLEPGSVRSDLLQHFRRMRQASAPPNYAFEEETLYETHRAPVRWIRRLLNPLLKLFFNPNPIVNALNIQAKLNEANSSLDDLRFEILHNLVVEQTRTGIEVKNLRIQVASLAAQLESTQRRAHALERVVVYKPEEQLSSERRSEGGRRRRRGRESYAPPAAEQPAASPQAPPREEEEQT